MLLSPEAMHIPDGFLNVPVSILACIIAVVVIGYALKRVSRDLDERQVPMMGVLAAAIFAGQMLNFAVAGGTSGHLMGAALAVILLGPWPAVLVMTSVVSVQALILQDGGLLALGANLLNMGIIGVAVSYAVFSLLSKVTGKYAWGTLASGFLAAWSSIEVAALGVGLQLVLSGTSPANIALPAMAGIHAVIGIGEGLITLGALAFISATRPDLLRAGSGAGADRLVFAVGLVIVILLAVLSPLASSSPDGLEWVAGQQGFLDKAQGPAYELIPDYVMPGVSNEALATILAGVVGALIVFGAVVGITLVRRKRST
jgi:cobalt/nickel transport system permease protein